jgi:GntR family transcriptional regulator, transcriptional repressor for pyruvate dehydrogenase complex
LLQLQRTPFESIVEVRAAIEPMICRLAAERIGDDVLAQLRANITEMGKYVDTDEDNVLQEL